MDEIREPRTGISRRGLLAGIAVGVGAAAVANSVQSAPSNALPGNGGGLLHYDTADGKIGDVHPYFANGTWYLFYLRVGGSFSSMLSTSTDKLNWTPVPLTRSSARPPAQNYCVLGVVKHGSLYRSWYGNGGGDHARSSESTDLITWRDPGRRFDLPVTVDTYPAGGRDPYVFWDADVSRFRAVMTTYRVNNANGLDASVSLATTAGTQPYCWGPQTDMVRFANTGVPVGSAKDPECSQMFKIGTRWYLLTSVSRQTVHTVGPADFWIGQPSTAIDADSWSTKTPWRVDGEDLCAAQVAQANGKTYLFGWIPYDPLGNEWGGHLALPRELYALADGTLCTRLDPDVAGSVSTTQTWPVSGSPNLAIDQGAPSWTTTATTATYSGTSWGIVRVPITPNRFDLTFTVDMSAGAVRTGCLFNSAAAGPWGLELALHREDGKLRIRWDVSGNGGWQQYAETPVRPGDLDGVNTVRAIVEANMVEFFVNDRYSLAARVPFTLSTGNVRLFAWQGGAHFSNVRVRALV